MSDTGLPPDMYVKVVTDSSDDLVAVLYKKVPWWFDKKVGETDITFGGTVVYRTVLAAAKDILRRHESIAAAEQRMEEARKRKLSFKGDYKGVDLNKEIRLDC